ncbi:MAG: ABC transporter ATP-binding protein [Clostridia bacterium]
MDKENLENECVIEIKNLRKDYKMYKTKKARLLEAVLPFYQNHGTFSAINDLNLEIHKGEVLGILGKNGAGKSTLLKMITGVVTPTSGTIKVNGKISSLLELGAAFNQELTGEENIYQHGQVMGLTKEEIEATKQDIIDFADIGDHLYQPVKTYSSGMFARLAFACAINVNPDILIVDEVLSVGDIAFQLKCFKKFEQFKEKGKTILFVTHNITDVIRNCNRAIIISDGSKIFDGNVKDGVEKYKKIIAKQDEDKKEIDEKEKLKNEHEQSLGFKNNNQDEWKKNYAINPNIIEYGNGQADLIDFGIFDTNGNILTSIPNDREIILKSKVVFNEKIIDPIFTMTVKDFKGLDMMGTNTLIEKIVTGTFEKGDTAIIEFKQKISLAPNKYTLSFSCTHFDGNGELEVLSRKYDALLVEITSNKDTVGLYRLDSDINIIKTKGAN